MEHVPSARVASSSVLGILLGALLMSCAARPLPVPEQSRVDFTSCIVGEPAMLLASDVDYAGYPFAVGDAGVFYAGIDRQIRRVRRDGGASVPLAPLRDLRGASLALAGPHLYASTELCDHAECSSLVDIDPESGAVTPLVPSALAGGPGAIVADEAGVFWASVSDPGITSAASIKGWTSGGGFHVLTEEEYGTALGLDRDELFVIPQQGGWLVAFDRTSSDWRVVMSEDDPPHAFAISGEELFIATDGGNILKRSKHGGPATMLAADHFAHAVTAGADAVYWIEDYDGLFCVPRGGGPVVQLEARTGPAGRYRGLALFDHSVYFVVDEDPSMTAPLSLFKIQQ